MSLFSFEVDPHKVLGVTAHASLQEIRDAYRQKAKRYHPDTGGEEWSFRILVQAYEMLSAARVARATHVDPPPERQHTPRARPERNSDGVHAGIHDHGLDPSRLIGVELLCVRYLWDDAEYLWLTQRAPDQERFLSCNLNIIWPDNGVSERPDTIPGHASIVSTLQDIFDQMIITSSVVTSQSRSDDDRFAGWLSYSNFDRAWKSVNTLHELVRTRGLGLRQWSRDLFIPRGWR